MKLAGDASGSYEEAGPAVMVKRTVGSSQKDIVRKVVGNLQTFHELWTVEGETPIKEVLGVWEGGERQFCCGILYSCTTSPSLGESSDLMNLPISVSPASSRCAHSTLPETTIFKGAILCPKV